jgi:23S rRNA A1618 N6-methylase RlmF
MVTPGGEIAFVTRMLEESQITKTRIRYCIISITINIIISNDSYSYRWYTCMLGKRSSVDQLLTKIKQCNVNINII